MPHAILVVDAVALTRRYLAHCVREVGWEAAEAASASEALALLDGQKPFDLLLISHPMPGEDDLALAQAARALRPGLPVILVVGEEMLAKLTTSARRESVRLLRKPLSIMELEEALAVLHQGRVSTARDAAE